jgi:hypothetical protein
MNKVYLSLWLLLPLLLAGCREQSQWMTDLQSGDRSLVVYRRPESQLFPARPDKEQLKALEQAKKYFAGHPQLLAGIAAGLKHRERDIINDLEPGPLLRDGQGNLVLSYFGRYESPMIMAGVKVLVSFNRQADLAGIHVFEVPLE